MNTIGQILRSARDQKRYSLAKLETITKIKSDFIEAIEKEKWEKLPPFATVLGFVKSISAAVGVDPKMTVAVLKRDYPPRKLNVNPKPDVASKFIWSPKMTFTVGIIIALIAIFGYLGLQYYRFLSPPRLIVESPKDSQVVTGGSVQVFGSTESDAKITVNNQPVLVDDSGNFSVGIEVVSETKEIVIKAVTRSGKTTTVSRKIEVK